MLSNPWFGLFDTHWTSDLNSILHLIGKSSAICTITASEPRAPDAIGLG
jgi:hypothetical protein